MDIVAQLFNVIFYMVPRGIDEVVYCAWYGVCCPDTTLDSMLTTRCGYGDDILDSKIISASCSQHGVQSCVWAADSVTGAINHLVNATRHHDNIKELGYNIHIFGVNISLYSN